MPQTWYLIFCCCFSSFSNVKFKASVHEAGTDSVTSEEPSGSQSEQQGETQGDEEIEGNVQTSQEQIDEDSSDKEDDETRAAQVQENTEGSDDKINNENVQEGQATAVIEDAVMGAFLQVSEPALVSSHHDGFLRFWNLSVSLVVTWKLELPRLCKATVMFIVKSF